MATTTTSSPPPPPASISSSKRLLFDRRYGWVLDEWKDPSQEALSAGRAMFCIVPLSKAVFDKASQSVNFIANSTVHVLERPELLSPKVVQATLSDQMHKIASSVKNTRLFIMTPKKKESTSCSSDLAEENSGSI